jgi:uncharacterized protein YegL
MERRPGGAIARRELHLIWLLDASGSMNADGKIQALNAAIQESIGLFAEAADNNPDVELLARAVTFSTGARWHIETPTPVARVRWNKVVAQGRTDLGAALHLVADALKVPPMPAHALPPMLILVTDGYHTDDFDSGMHALLAQRWGQLAVRTAIAIGGEDCDRRALKTFQGNDQEPLRADSPEEIVQQIRWASEVGINTVSAASSDRLNEW